LPCGGFEPKADILQNRRKQLNHKVEKSIFMSLRGPKALDDKGHEGSQRGLLNEYFLCVLCG
jgi:hypothetical protein